MVVRFEVNDGGDGGCDDDGWWPMRRRKEKRKKVFLLQRVKGLKKGFVKIPKCPSSGVCTKVVWDKGVYESFS